MSNLKKLRTVFKMVIESLDKALLYVEDTSIYLNRQLEGMQRVKQVSRDVG